jgi:hypothetical protein
MKREMGKLGRREFDEWILRKVELDLGERRSGEWNGTQGTLMIVVG